jgi:hypothetical protein
MWSVILHRSQTGASFYRTHQHTLGSTRKVLQSTFNGVEKKRYGHNRGHRRTMVVATKAIAYSKLTLMLLNENREDMQTFIILYDSRAI